MAAAACEIPALRSNSAAAQAAAQGDLASSMARTNLTAAQTRQQCWLLAALRCFSACCTASTQKYSRAARGTLTLLAFNNQAARSQSQERAPSTACLAAARQRKRGPHGSCSAALYRAGKPRRQAGRGGSCRWKHPAPAAASAWQRQGQNAAVCCRPGGHCPLLQHPQQCWWQRIQLSLSAAPPCWCSACRAPSLPTLPFSATTYPQCPCSSVHPLPPQGPPAAPLSPCS